MKLIFHGSTHHLQDLITDGNCPASSIKLFNQPLIVRNVALINKLYEINKVMIPEGFPDAIKLVQENFPSIEVQGFQQPDSYDFKVNICGTENFEVPLNSLIMYSHDKTSLSLEPLIYPWNFLKVIQKILSEELTDQVISPTASIAETAIIKGPCVIEDNVCIDDFCKIVGPTYISRGSFVGMSSLVRNCVLGNNTRIGFNCEIGKTYFAGNAKISHQNVILDSIIGENVWFGGYSGTANVLLTRENVRYTVGTELIDTGTDHFGAVVGNDCAVGASVIILPGRQLPCHSLVQSGTVYGDKKQCLPTKNKIIPIDPPLM
ncbi:MAG: hypothetical protein WB511_11480 [Nitrososphaeraceae archaeon]